MCVCVLFYVKDLSILRHPETNPVRYQGTCTVSPLHMNFQRCECSPVCQLLYCTTVLFKVLYCQIKMFSSFFVLAFMCYLWEKYYKPTTVQCHVANCVSWVPRLTLLDLKIDWTYKHAPGMKIVHM